MNLHVESSLMKKIDSANYLERQPKPDPSQIKHLSPAAMTLDENGFIRECDSADEMVLGYQRHELFLQHISCLFPTLAQMALMHGKQLNPMLSYICHCGHYFEALSKQGNFVICNLNFVLVENENKQNLRMIMRPVSNARS